MGCTWLVQEKAGNEQQRGGNDEGTAVQSLDGLGELEASRFQAAGERSGAQEEKDWLRSHEAHHWIVAAHVMLSVGHLPASAAMPSEE